MSKIKENSQNKDHEKCLKQNKGDVGYIIKRDNSENSSISRNIDKHSSPNDLDKISHFENASQSKEEILLVYLW